MLGNDDGLVGGIEAGGTKFRVAVARGIEIVDDTTILTTTPDETIGGAVDFLAEHEIGACGIASFGPLDLDPGSPSYGSIIATPKPHWSDTDLLGRVRDALKVPVAIDVDVGGAALAEWRWGAAHGLDTFIYFTIGTGIGGGLFNRGEVHHGLGHPEMGHIAMRRESDDDFAGHCPFHGDCFEGLAAGPAISARWGARTHDLLDRPEVWDLEARYIAQAMRSFTYALAPQRIVLGGGVLQKDGLLDRVVDYLGPELGGYVTSPLLESDLDRYIVGPHFGQDAGLIGSFALAQKALETS